MMASQKAHFSDHAQGLNSLQELALTLLRNGYYPLRLELGQKKPGYNGWLDNLPTEESLIRDFARPSNIGLIQGVAGADNTFPVTIDIDVDNGALVAYVERVIGTACPMKRGKSP